MIIIPNNHSLIILVTNDQTLIAVVPNGQVTIANNESLTTNYQSLFPIIPITNK